MLEQTREAHEEVERLERAIVADFKTEAVTHKERLLQNHRVNRMLDEMVTKTKRLVRRVVEFHPLLRCAIPSTQTPAPPP